LVCWKYGPFSHNFAPVRPIREITAYFSILLLALANMGSHSPAIAVSMPAPIGFEQTRLAATPSGKLDYLRTQQFSAEPGNAHGATTVKQPVSLAFFKLETLNTQQVSGVGYFILTKFLLIGFPSTDVIFPFHQFW
jgi:hypothetical protein